LVGEREHKRELLEEAFHLAAKAQQPFRRRYLGGLVDTRTGFLAYAFDQRLDRLSLQTSAIEKLLPLDASKARELIWQMPKLEVPATKCEESLIPEVSAFYEMLLKATQQGFTPEQLANGEHVSLVAPHLEAISSPVQVAPAIMLLSKVKTTPEQLASLVKSLADGLEKVSGDDRAFSEADYPSYQSLTHLLLLGSVCVGKGFVPLELYEKHRAYLVRNMTGGRCTDNVLSTNGEPRKPPPAVAGFNNLIAAKLETLAPIKLEGLKPAKLEARMRIYNYWQTPQAKRLLQKIKELRFGDWEK
jgi:hypothetical protein